jgi:hypothetical protein
VGLAGVSAICAHKGIPAYKEIVMQRQQHNFEYTMAQQVKISQPTSTPTPTIQQGSSSS